MRVSIFKLFLVCVILGGTAYGITFLRGSRGIGDEGKRRQIEQLERDISVLRREIATRQERMNDLKHNRDRYKLEIEDRLKLVTPGTKNFILQDGTPSTTPPAN